ncbi:MAG: glucan biosynthesis protein [Sphingomonas adhaesiva]|uniref:glucan biosynthesis protein n=1 Tax=Sphingomonas adhaesiva TaxID=28212 RepID=UPI002FF54623
MPLIDRRSLMIAGGALTALPFAARAAPGAGTPFSWNIVQQRAAALARQPYRPPTPVAAAAAIDFDAVGAIRFRPDRTLAGGIRLFPLGNGATLPVAINIVEGGRARAVAFSPDLFEAKASVPPGFAGFRIMEAGRESDWLAFLGATYFRAAGSQDQYGLSARAVAIDTGLDGREQFPRFTEFWIEPTGTRHVIYALLDGESVTGACRFTSTHDGGVMQDVSVVLHLRRDIARLGIAPATSMFWYDDRAQRGATDWRPEIHDSDGLAIWTAGGERLWRPLRNPARPTTDSFDATDVRGFGLIQRDRAFDHYQDDGAFYDRRPDLWVEPRGTWGAGEIMLYAFPTTSETVDNVAAFWVPAAPARAGQRLQFDYRLRWTSQDPSADRGARVVDARVGDAGRPGAAAVAGARKLVVDYQGDGLIGLTRDSGVVADLSIAHGRLLASAAYPVVGQRDRWRVTADIAPDPNATADVRLFLRRGAAALGETLLFPLDLT